MVNMMKTFYKPWITYELYTYKIKDKIRKIKT